MRLKRRFVFTLLPLLMMMPYATKATATTSVWNVLREEFKLNHELNQPAVQHQLHWLMNHPGYLNQLAQSQPYMYHIITEIKKRGIPGEIALIPMIESSYDPFAYSGVGAAGLWQLMPKTGSELGLKQDWWFDARRSIRSSTNAALHYLMYLNTQFNHQWLLAFAAYDAGEGTVSRSIKQHQAKKNPPDFWSLPLPQETKNYIPRLLALAEIIQHPERYHITLPNIPHIPYFEEVNIGSQIDLNHAAKLAGISYKDLIKLNPGFNHWATAPHQPYKLLIPANRVDYFSHNLSLVPFQQRVSLVQYQVKAHDSLIQIAAQHHTTVNLIKKLNQLKSDTLKEGQAIIIPSSKNTITEPQRPVIPKAHFATLSRYKIIHVVQSDENLASIAKKYTMNPKDILAWNQLKKTNIHAGQTLILWKTV